MIAGQAGAAHQPCLHIDGQLERKTTLSRERISPQLPSSIKTDPFSLEMVKSGFILEQILWYLMACKPSGTITALLDIAKMSSLNP